MTGQFESFVERPKPKTPPKYVYLQMEQAKHNPEPPWHHPMKRVPGVRRPHHAHRTTTTNPPPHHER